MRYPIRRVAFGATFLAIITLGASVQAQPVLVGPPPVVDGKLMPMPTVKKWGQYWYPASLVGYRRGIEFAYDAATNTLYADGSKLEMDTIVIDGTVYIPLQPVITQAGLRPGMEALEVRRPRYEALQAGAPEHAGSMDALFMENSVDMPEHPWAEGASYTPTGPIIDLDPTGVSSVPSHLQTMPVASGPVAPLPGRLPTPGLAPIPQADSQATLLAPTRVEPGGMPLKVTTRGGPEAAGAELAASSPVASPATTSAVSYPTGLQPIPPTPSSLATSKAKAGDGMLAPVSGRNQAFEVRVSGATLKGDDNPVLHLQIAQTNLSPVAQANLGSFALRCQDGVRVEPVRSRSVMPEGTLAPGGVREGELTFRLSPGAVPTTLELEGTLPLSLKLMP